MDTTLTTPVRRRATRQAPWPKGIYVGRPRKFGNPYKVGTHGTAAECVALYRALLLGDGVPHPKPTRPNVTIETVRAELRGQDLLCWCPLDQPCHADVLLELANQ